MTAGPAPTHSEVSPGTEGIVSEGIGTGAISTEAVRAVVQAVSYTHLDVYKRQPRSYGRAGIPASTGR